MKKHTTVLTKFIKQRFFAVLIFLFITSNTLFSANPTLVQTIKTKAINVFVNSNNQVYVMYKGMLELFPLNESPVLQYGSKYINKNTRIISVNSFKTILYSEDYGKIMVLDNRLKQSDIIDIYELGNSILISCVGASLENNNIWIFDMATQKVSKMDENHKVIFTSNSIAQAMGKEINPTQMYEFGMYLFLIDEKNGIFIFDTQGNYLKNIPIADAHNLCVASGKFYYTKQDFVYEYDPMTFTETKYLKTPDLKRIHMGSAILAGINEQGYVEIWKF